MGRIQTAANPALAILSGQLGPALCMHAAQRAEYFFLYLFYYKALSDRLRALYGVMLGNADGVRVKATHQIATGLRSGDDAYYDFPVKDASIINELATACGRMDAAHYCNLGIDPGFLNKANAYARPDVDRVAFDLRDHLEVMAGATRQLPQRINIGPDRIVDQVHGRLAFEFLNGAPPVSVANYQRYLADCAAYMKVYRKDQFDKGNLGVAACCDCYLAFYGGAVAPHPDDAWKALWGTVQAECGGFGLDCAGYLSTSVH